MDKNSHFKVSTERPQKLVEMIVKPYSKLKNSLHFKVQKSTAGYSSLSDIITTEPDAIYPTTRGASSIFSRKENNWYTSIVGINSNAPQVAPRTTREYPTSTAISLTQFFFPV